LNRRAQLVLAALMVFLAPPVGLAQDVRVKDLGRFLGWRDNALVGYGVVMGLAGSGDSSRNVLTQQALANVLGRLGASVTPDQVQSRNVAVVIATATLPASANVGDRIDVAVSSIGDARSLVGGTLLMTPLLGPDHKSYALAQGSLVVGGYRFDSNFNREQKNYPTAGILPGGATVEEPVSAVLEGTQGELTFILNNPDVTTAERIKKAIDAALGPNAATVTSASAIRIDGRSAGRDVYRQVAMIEGLGVNPDNLARVVVNERTGTVVSGGRVQISSVTISQGDVRVSVSIDDQAPYAPIGDGEYDRRGSRHLVVTNTKLAVTTPNDDAVVSFPDTTVADLVTGLARVHIDTRGIIAILQAIRAAGALHADIVVQ
jgi:flagellar P-ring protein precursor FlgI